MKLRNTSYLAILLIVLSILFAGCGDPVKDDLVNYDKSCEDALKIMQTIEQDLNTTDQASMGKVLKENAEKLTNAKKSIESIDIKTQELKDVSAILVDALGLTAEGCKTIGEAVEDPTKADQKAVTDAQGKLTKGMQRFTEFSQKYEELAKAHDLQIQK